MARNPRISCLLVCWFIFCVKYEAASHDSNIELVMANVLYRHGDRSPVTTFPNDEHRHYWKEGLGQLTEKGMKQEFEMGKFLKRRYVSKLINQKYMRKQVYCRSSDKDRTIMSAEAQMAGLYPSNYYQNQSSSGKDWQFWQLIPIHSVPKQYDKLLRPLSYDCPRYREIQNKSYSDPEFVKVEQEYKKLILNVSKAVGFTKSLTPRTIYQVYDMLFCQKAHNLSMPKWLTPELYDKLSYLNTFDFYWLFNTPEKSRLTGGVLLGEMVENMKKFARNPGNAKKLRVYSAHDSTVVGLLSALKIYSGIPPPYSTAFLMELYYNKDSKTHTVRMFYRNDTTRPTTVYEYFLPGCKSSCTLDNFVKQTASAIPVDYDAECLNTSESLKPHQCLNTSECLKPHQKKENQETSCKDTLTAVIIILLLLFIAIIGYIVFRCQKRRKATGRSRFRQIQAEEWDSD